VRQAIHDLKTILFSQADSTKCVGLLTYRTKFCIFWTIVGRHDVILTYFMTSDSLQFDFCKIIDNY